jgi:hypothetical protein
MNDFDLESKLKSVRVPEQPDEYWNDFPSRVRVQLRQARIESAPRSQWRPRLAWAGGFTLALAMAFVCIEYHPLQAASAAITQNERHFHGQLARLDAGLHKLILNTDGMGYLLTEAN